MQLKLFEEIENRQYISKLFFVVNDIIPTGDTKECVKEVDGVTVTKKLASGYGINLYEEESLFNRCKNVRVFTREIDLALLSGDREMFLYASKNGEDVEIHQIRVVDKYVYISDKEVASPKPLNEGEGYTDEYFVNLKEYVLTDRSEFDGFLIEYDKEAKVFRLVYGDEELVRIDNAQKAYSYPYVLYLLNKLADKEPSCGFETNLRISRIRNITQ